MPLANLKNVDLNLLVVFEAIYAAGNISHAAVQLNMSQPAVSNALTRLRDILGDPLFVREKQGVKPTVRADALIGPVREALGLIGRQFHSGDEIDLSTYKRTFRILVIDPLEPLVMPHLLRIVDERAHGVTIESVPPFGMDFAAEILAGRLDLAIYVYPINAPQIVAAPAGGIDPVIVARRDHPLIHGKVTKKLYETLGHVVLVPSLRGMAHVEKDLIAQGVRRRVVYAVPKLWSVPAIVARTDLIAVLPRDFASEIGDSFGLAIYEPPVPLSTQYYYMMWHEKSADDPGHKWLREALLAGIAGRGTSSGNVVRLDRTKGAARPARNGSRPRRLPPA